MQSTVLLLLLTLALIVGAIATDTQCKAMHPSSNTVVLACSAGKAGGQP